MGVGDPVSIVEAVAGGVDMFDCVLPTRLARHGTLLTGSGRLNIKRGEFARSDEPISDTCGCATCSALHPRLPAAPDGRRRTGRRHAVHGAQPHLDARLLAGVASRSPSEAL